MMTVDDVQQIDPELVEDGRSVCFYGWTADDDLTLVWSVALPMEINEDAFEDLLLEWRQLGWLLLVRL
ncbi:hypothetical protein [Rhizobium leguminosarum]